MNDRHERQLAASTRGEQRQDVKGRHCAKLVAVEDNAVLQLAAMLIRHGKKFTREVLNHQTRHKVFGIVFLRKYKENRGFLGGKVFRIDGTVKTKHLLQLGIQKSIQPGQHC